jgi:DNA helicase-2/ATP-dependent DNA helicase PcrA
LQTKISTGPKVILSDYSSDEEEAKSVAEKIQALIKSGYEPRDIAILFRINSQSEVFEAALAQRQIPVTLRGTERFFERPEIKNALLNLRAGLHVSSAHNLTQTVKDILGGLGWRATTPEGGPATRAAWESLNTLVELAVDVEAENALATLADFVTLLDQRNEMEYAPSANAVTLASIHAAKGLEWRAVFLVGLSDGLLPISHATKASEFAEERRLFYVAITRAKENLVMSWSHSRHKDAKGYREPSPLLRDLVIS